MTEAASGELSNRLAPFERASLEILHSKILVLRPYKFVLVIDISNEAYCDGLDINRTKNSSTHGSRLKIGTSKWID